MEDQPSSLTAVNDMAQGSEDLRQKQNSPSIISLSEFSDDEVALATDAPLLVNTSTEMLLNSCQICKARHQKCLHDETHALRKRSLSAASCKSIDPVTGEHRSQSLDGMEPRHDTESVDLATIHTVEGLQNGQKGTTLGIFRDDSPDVVDITLWTQRNPVTRSPHQRKMSQHSLSSSAAYGSSTSLHNKLPPETHHITDSPGSTQSSTSIPYNATEEVEQVIQQGNGPALLVDETITIPPGHSIENQWYKPMEVTIWEGSPELHEFPAYLYQQLVLACAQRRTDVPDCVRDQWPATQTIYKTATGERVKFVDPATGEDLLMARYHYGNKLQLNVVKQKNGAGFNGGKAAIVNYQHQSSEKPTVGGCEVISHVWNIWDPTKDPAKCGYVERVMETVAAKEAVKPVSVARPFDSIHGALPDAHCTRTQSSQDDTSGAVKHLSKRIRLSSDDMVNSTLGNRGIRRTSEGYILAERAADGTTVKLLCPKCLKHDFETVQGLGNHCRIQHEILLTNNREFIDACGVPISEGVRKDKSHTMGMVGITKPDREAVRSYATRAPSVVTLESDEGPVFMFKKNDVDLKPRVRSLKACDSAEKLFVNALVAGVAKKDTLMLTVQVGDDEPINIMRGDAEDFKTVLQAVDNAGSEDGLVVVVTVDDFDV